MNFFKGNKFFAIIVFSVIIVGLVYLSFNEYGLLKYSELKKEIDSLNLKVSEVISENKKLKEEIDSLENKIPAKIEKIAREKYGMSRKNEVVIKVEEK